MLYANTHTQSFSNENWALLYNCPMTCFFYLIPSLGGSGGKASACNAGDLGSVSGLGRSLGEQIANHSSILWRKKWQPTPVFLPGESQGQRSLVGCRLWGHTESDTTEAT